MKSNLKSINKDIILLIFRFILAGMLLFLGTIYTASAYSIKFLAFNIEVSQLYFQSIVILKFLFSILLILGILIRMVCGITFIGISIALLSTQLESSIFIGTETTLLILNLLILVVTGILFLKGGGKYSVYKFEKKWLN